MSENFSNLTPPRIILTPSQIAIQNQLATVAGILAQDVESILSFKQYGLGQEAERVQRTQGTTENEADETGNPNVLEFMEMSTKQLRVLSEFLTTDQKAVENTIEEKPVFSVKGVDDLLEMINNDRSIGQERKERLSTLCDNSFLFRIIFCYCVNYKEITDYEHKSFFFTYNQVRRFLTRIIPNFDENNFNINELTKKITEERDKTKLDFYDFLKAHEIVLENDGNEDV
jgi:hypothetical protein